MGVTAAVAADAAAPAALGEAAVTDAALTEAAGATTLADGSVITAGGTVLPAAGAVDAATGVVTATGDTVLSSTTSPTGFVDGATGEAVNADGTAYIEPSATPANTLNGVTCQYTSSTGQDLTSTPANVLNGALCQYTSAEGQSLTSNPANVLNGALCQYTTCTGASTTGNCLPACYQNIAKQAFQQGMKKLMQPFPSSGAKPTSSLVGSSGAITSPGLMGKAGSFLCPTTVYTGNATNNPVLKQLSQLSPQQYRMTPSELNVLANTTGGLGSTTTPNLITESAMPVGGVFPSEESLQSLSQAKKGGSMGALVKAVPHRAEFITGHTGHYAQGSGTGQSDDIPALLKDGDYVIDADIVSALGDGSSKAGAERLHEFMNRVPHKHYEEHAKGGHINAMIADGEFVFPSSLVTALGGGSNKEGARKLDEMREKIRAHKRSASNNNIPPKAKSPLEYMKGR